MAIKRALTIDDDVETRRNLRSGLLAAGWEVDEAPDGISALEQLRRLSSEGGGYQLITCAAVLPDLDSKLLLQTLRSRYPQVPFIVLSVYPASDERDEWTPLEPLACLEHHLLAGALPGVLASLDLTASTREAVLPGAGTPDQLAKALAFLRLKPEAAWEEAYRSAGSLPGVHTAYAVKGDYDLILYLTAPGGVELRAAYEAIASLPEAAAASLELLEQPLISADTASFLASYEALASRALESEQAAASSQAFLIVDIDRYQVERVFLSIMLTEGVVKCHVAANGSKLIVLISGAVRPEVLRHVFRKLAVLEGIRRLRELPVIDLDG